jgi:hypothetical protein
LIKEVKRTQRELQLNNKRLMAYGLLLPTHVLLNLAKFLMPMASLVGMPEAIVSHFKPNLQPSTSLVYKAEPASAIATAFFSTYRCEQIASFNKVVSLYWG